MNQELENELEWSPVWTNIFYVVYTLIAVTLLWIYRKRWKNLDKKLNITIHLFILSSIVLCVVSTLHHLNSSAFHDHSIHTTASKAFDISDQIFAWLTLILMFLIMYITKTSGNILYTICVIFYIITLIMAVILYFLAVHYDNQGKYNSYDIYHSDWHILTSFLGVITIIIIFNYVGLQKT